MVTVATYLAYLAIAVPLTVWVAAAGLRSMTTSTTSGGGYGDACAGSCEPLPQG